VAVRAVDEEGNVGWLGQIDTGPGVGAGNGRRRGARLKPGHCANARLGSRGADRLRGTEADDRLRGLAGRDRLAGRGGADCLEGGRGRDRLEGGPGDDTLDGNGGRDLLAGGPGRDVLLGGADQDSIRADDGERDVVDCRGGRHDIAIADGSDAVQGCETVRLRDGPQR
jgi:Ca2+-binding RTX toxin-like protein